MKKEESARRKRKLQRKSEPEEKLPPDPGYIPKVRITTFRSLAGGTLFSSNQFRPGEERSTRRSSRRKTDFESKNIDLSEFHGWEKSHMERKRKRRREGLGLPSDDDNIQQGFEIDLPCNISDGIGFFLVLEFHREMEQNLQLKKLVQGLITSLIATPFRTLISAGTIT